MPQTSRINHCRRKLTHCARLARETNHQYLALGNLEWRWLRDEAMRDARYWRRQLHATTEGE